MRRICIIMLYLMVLLANALSSYAADKPDIVFYTAQFLDRALHVTLQWQSVNPVTLVRVSAGRDAKEVKVDEYDNKRVPGGYSGEVTVNIPVDPAMNQRDVPFILQIEDDLRQKSELVNSKALIAAGTASPSYMGPPPHMGMQPQQDNWGQENLKPTPKAQGGSGDILDRLVELKDKFDLAPSITDIKVNVMGPNNVAFALKANDDKQLREINFKVFDSQGNMVQTHQATGLGRVWEGTSPVFKLSGGNYRVSAQAIDSAGNTSKEQAATFVLTGGQISPDTQQPQVATPVATATSTTSTTLTPPVSTTTTPSTTPTLSINPTLDQPATGMPPTQNVPGALPPVAPPPGLDPSQANMMQPPPMPPGPAYPATDPMSAAPVPLSTTPVVDPAQINTMQQPVVPAVPQANGSQPVVVPPPVPDTYVPPAPAVTTPVPVEQPPANVVQPPVVMPIVPSPVEVPPPVPVPAALPTLEPTVLAPANIDITGVWDSSEGQITFRQTGNVVKARYSQDNGSIDGIMTDTTLDGYWTEGTSAQRCSSPYNGNYHWGRLSFVFVGPRFRGSWGYCNNPPDHLWTGARR